MAVLPATAFDRMLRINGAARVSEAAAIELRDTVEQIGEELAIDAVRIAKHAGRKTVKASDILLVKNI